MYQREYPDSTMPQVYPFRAVQFSTGADVSALVAPPYDVLDASGKAALLAKDARNIVAIDLPHTPAKELGPPAAYQTAAETYSKLQSQGVLKRSMLPGMYAYRQTFRSADGSKMIQRSGMTCCVDAVPFGPRKGGGILPHEETFSGPKEDRLALMRATKAQMSPIFGLFADEKGVATKIVRNVMEKHRPNLTARTADGTLHEVWTIQDTSTIRAYQAALDFEDIFIADGHHRYTTGLNYLKEMEASGSLPADHPARRSMMVLIGMSDPGLVIWPTHRVLGGMKDYSLDAFLAACKGQIEASPVSGGLEAIEAAIESKSDFGPMRFGIFDVKTGKALVARPASADPLAARFADKPKAWRELVVAFTQYVLVEELCEKKLNGGEKVKWAFPHTIPEVAAIAKGEETGAGGGKVFGSTGAQLAVIVRPTPLEAVRDVSRAGVLMPQKSTFFYPKLATGLFMNPLA